MKILHINKRYPPHIGGVETVVRDLARVQAGRSGTQVDVVVVADGPAGVEWDGPVRVLRVRGLAELASNPLSVGIFGELRRSAGAVGRVRGAIGGGPLHDVWHFHYPFPTGESSFLVERLLSRRGGGHRDLHRHGPLAVCTYHSDFVPQTRFKRAMARPYAAVTHRFLEELDAIVVSSPQMAEHSAPLQGVRAKTWVIPFGIDPAHLASTPEIERRVQELRGGSAAPLALFVGRLVPYKGVEVLLRAFRYVPGRLIIVGDGPLRLALESQAAAFGLADRVSFVGSLPREALTAHFRAADLFVLPSITPNEAFGLVQLEAHACGVPVVSTRLASGVPFVNAHGETGLVVTPGDPVELAAAMDLLLGDDALRCELGRRARERFEAEFSLQVMGDRVLGLYERLLGERRSLAGRTVPSP